MGTDASVPAPASGAAAAATAAEPSYVEEFRVRLETIQSKMVAMKATMATKADLGRVFEQAVEPKIARSHGELYTRKFEANSAYGLIRLSVPKAHTVPDTGGPLDDAGWMAKYCKAFVKYAITTFTKSVALPSPFPEAQQPSSSGAGSDGKEEARASDDDDGDDDREEESANKCRSVNRCLHNLRIKLKSDSTLHDYLSRCTGGAIVAACILAFAPGSLVLPNRRGNLAELRHPSIRTLLELDCRGTVEEFGDTVHITCGEIKNGADWKYGVHQLAMILLLRAFTHWIVKGAGKDLDGAAPRVKYALRGTIFLPYKQDSWEATSKDICESLVQALREAPFRDAVDLHVAVVRA